MEDFSEQKEQKRENLNIRVGIIFTYFRLITLIVIALFYSPYLLKVFTDKIYGIYLFAISIVSWTSLLSLGCELSFIRFVTIAKEKSGDKGVSEKNGFYWLLFLIVAFIMLLSGVLIALLFKYRVIPLNDYTNDQINLLFILLILCSANSALQMALTIFSLFIQFNSRFIVEAGLNLLARFIDVGLGLIIIKINPSIIWFQVGTGITAFIISLCRAFYCIKHLSMHWTFPNPRKFREEAKDILSFSAYIFLALIVDQINANVGKTTLGFFDPSLVTIFALGYDLFGYEQVIAFAISDNFRPKITKLAIEGKHEEVKRLFTKISKMQLLVLFFIVGGFYSCGKQFVIGWVGEERIDVFYLGLILLTMWILPLSQSIGIVIQRAYNKHHFLALFNLGFSVLNIGTTIICELFISGQYRLYAALSGMLLYCLATTIASNIYYKKTFDLPIGLFFRNFLLFLLLTLISASFSILLFNYGVSLESFHPWVNALFRGLAYISIFGLGMLLFFKKQIIAYVNDYKNKKKLKRQNQSK